MALRASDFGIHVQYPLTEKDVPIEAGADVAQCVVCGNRGYKDSTMMMRITSHVNDWVPMWVHTDICWNKWHLGLLHEEEE